MNSSFHSQAGRSFFPSPASIAYEGVYYQHFFSVPPTDHDVIKVSCSAVTSPDPLSREDDHFLCLGVSSKYDGPGLRRHGNRPPIELVFVLDISGSMGDTFRNLSAKALRQGPSVVNVSEREKMTKLEAAKYALIEMLDNFRDGDSFGLVTFNTSAQEVIPLTKWDKEKKETFVSKIKQISLGGGTDLTCGFTGALKTFEKSDAKSPSPTYRWVFYLTDMVMTSGNSGELLKQVSKASKNSDPIYTQIIGFGFDFDVQLASLMSRIPLLSYFSVNSTDEFVDQMTWEFDYLVFPIATNFQVSLQSNKDACSVEAVCGSPTPLDEYPPGTLMVSSGCFASQTQGRNKDETKGGIVLVKLHLKDPSSPLTLRISYTTFDHQEIVIDETVTFPSSKSTLSSSESKGILLARYVAVMKAFLKDINDFQVKGRIGTLLQPDKRIPFVLEKAEEASGTNLVHTDIPEESKKYFRQYAETLEIFLAHFEAEASHLDDVGLSIWKEKIVEFIATLNKICENPAIETDTHTPIPSESN